MKHNQIKIFACIIMTFFTSACFCLDVTPTQESCYNAPDDPEALFLNDQDLDQVLIHIDALEQEQMKNLTLQEKISLLIMFFRLELENARIYTQDILKIVDSHIREHKTTYAIATVSACLVIAFYFYKASR